MFSRYALEACASTLLLKCNANKVDTSTYNGDFKHLKSFMCLKYVMENFNKQNREGKNEEDIVIEFMKGFLHCGLNEDHGSCVIYNG